VKHARERRRGDERRKAEKPLRARDRRRVAERRSIQVEEIPFEEWVARATERDERGAGEPSGAAGRAKRIEGRFFRKRAEQDRRQQEAGLPPGRKERRLHADRRGLVVREISYSEFLKHMRGRR